MHLRISESLSNLMWANHYLWGVSILMRLCEGGERGVYIDASLSQSPWQLAVPKGVRGSVLGWVIAHLLSHWQRVLSSNQLCWGHPTWCRVTWRTGLINTSDVVGVVFAGGETEEQGGLLFILPICSMDLFQINPRVEEIKTWFFTLSPQKCRD